MSARRKVELFSAGCPACKETIEPLNRVACPACEVTVLHVHDTRMKDFLQWMSTDGQKLTQELLYVPLHAEVVAKEQAAFSKIQ
jgi:hypothetical protein